MYLSRLTVMFVMLAFVIGCKEPNQSQTERPQTTDSVNLAGSWVGEIIPIPDYGRAFMHATFDGNVITTMHRASKELENYHGPAREVVFEKTAINTFDSKILKHDENRWELEVATTSRLFPERDGSITDILRDKDKVPTRWSVRQENGQLFIERVYAGRNVVFVLEQE